MLKLTSSPEEMLRFLERQEVDLFYTVPHMRTGKKRQGQWILCTATHETTGCTLKGTIQRSINEHTADGELK